MSDTYFIPEPVTCTCTGGKERVVPRVVLHDFARMPQASAIRLGEGPTYYQHRIRYCRVHGAFEVPSAVS